MKWRRLKTVCSKCGDQRDRGDQAYCVSCRREYERDRKRRHVMIPEEMVTEEQRQYLDRKRQGRRRVSREITLRIDKVSA